MKNQNGILKIVCVFIFLALLHNSANSQQFLTKINGWNAYVHLPDDYTTTTANYPVIVFIPGVGEVGTDPSKLLVYGPSYFISQGSTMNFTVNGVLEKPIVISIQPPTQWPIAASINTQIDSIVKRWRVNTNRIYLTGLSMGGWSFDNYITADPNYAKRPAAMVVMSAPESNYPLPNYAWYANAGGRWWGFEGTLDYRKMDLIRDMLNSTVPGSARYTQYVGGHCCWNTWYDPTWKDTDGETIYTWMLKQDKSGASVNQVPIVNAGTDVSLILPTNSVTLSGTATDPDGSIVSYQWNKVSGPTQFSISSPTTAQTNVTNLAQGLYGFELAATDNFGAIVRDTVFVTVSSATAPPPSPCNLAASKVYTLQPGSAGDIYIPDASTRGWKGGDTLRIPAGTYSLIAIGNFKGDSCRPIVIINYGGQVVVNGTGNMRFINDASYFKVTGTGSSSYQYGFKVNSTANVGVAMDLAHHVEINNVEVTGTQVGFYFKKAPVSTEPLSMYPNYVLSNYYIHHNYIHDTHGEGMYLGDTYPDSDPYNNNLIPIRMDKVEIAYNIVDGTDWDGIQLSNARSGAKIHDNTVTNFGRINMGAQQAGIILGGNTTGDIYNNTVQNGTGNGIEAFGYGTINIYNNTVINAGYDGTTNGQEEIFCNDPINLVETNPKQQINCYNNIIKNPMPKGAIRVGAYNANSLASNITNNTVYLVNAPTNWLAYYVVSNAPGSVISGNTVIR